MNEEFIAPNQEIENEIVDFCLDELKIPFGDFWYEWFDHNKKGHHTLKIQTVNLIDIKKEQLFKLSFIKRIYRIHTIDLKFIEHQIDDIRYICEIHFCDI